RSEAYIGVETASYRGIIVKTGGLLLTAVLSGYLALAYLPIEQLYPLFIASIFIALFCVIIASFIPRIAMPFAILYALAEGVVLGLVTVIFDSMAPGVALAAVVATAAIFTVMLFLYSSRTIRVTPRFRKVMYGVLLGFLLFIVIGFIMSLAGVAIEFSNPMLIGISAIFIIFGALMLTLDFDRAEMLVESGADKTYEWVVAIGLMVTIVWIYMELLRLLVIIFGNRN
ncbi:MAG: Bax inhibitor-1/YccA family protein, partial [Acholeplasmataceae bacterium]|nr:Bax inhibitor-1/YccA family protein [Acholeplasmataceae bacterium]